MKLPRHAEIWLLPYLKDRFWKSMQLTTPRRAWVAITDHYEPLGMGASIETALGNFARRRTGGHALPAIATPRPTAAVQFLPPGFHGFLSVRGALWRAWNSETRRSDYNTCNRELCVTGNLRACRRNDQA